MNVCRGLCITWTFTNQTFWLMGDFVNTTIVKCLWRSIALQTLLRLSLDIIHTCYYFSRSLCYVECILLLLHVLFANKSLWSPCIHILSPCMRIWFTWNMITFPGSDAWKNFYKRLQRVSDCCDYMFHMNPENVMLSMPG